MTFKYYLYGNDGEYSLGPLEKRLSSSKKDFQILKNFDLEMLRRLFQHGDETRKILVTSAHPGINRLSGRENVPIGVLRRLTDWEKVIYFPHDLTEPFRWEERVYLNDYDAIAHEFPIPKWILSYLPSIPTGLLPRLKVEIQMAQRYIFLPDNFYSFGLGTPTDFYRRFPFISSPHVVTKFVNVSGARNFYEDCSTELQFKFLDPEIPGFELIDPNNGILITNGESGVLTEAFCSNVSTVFIDELSRTEFQKSILKNRFPSISFFSDAKDFNPNIGFEFHGASWDYQVGGSIENLFKFCE